MSTDTQAPLTEVERIKADSRLLRGTLAESLADPTTGAIAPADTTVIKFHGSYQQEDRDVREERRQQKLEPDYSFMLRTRLPGGVATPHQWLVHDALARQYGHGTLRLTTRQTFQIHGILKGHLKPTIVALNQVLLDSIASCGDVNRNVIASANPVESKAHADVHALAVRLSEHLLPKTRAYYELWLGEEKVGGNEEEPLYGATYLPRKCKIAIAVPPINDVDVLAHDLGFIAILEAGGLAGFNVSVGGGMGATHGDPTTFPRLADVLGFIRPEQVVRVAEEVLKIYRDHGDRTDRKHARLKYVLARKGRDWFRHELERRVGFSLGPVHDFRFEHTGDRYGWLQGHDGRWHLTLAIESGRLADSPGQPHLTGLREIARIHQGDFRLTPNQNVIIANVAAEDRAEIDVLVERHRLGGYRTWSPLRRDALACVALPTCSLAMAEAERYLPRFTALLGERLAAHGIPSAPVLVRITGCPNGCARPYLAEVALVGKAPGRYNLHVGGDARGERLNTLYLENADERAILAALDPLLASYAKTRVGQERFGDWLIRTGSVRSSALS